MKQRVLTTIMAAALTLLSFGAIAQQSVNIEPKIKAIASEFENSKGVDCVEISEGLGLTMVKKAFTPQFGKEFMKGVTAITVIDYSDASQQTCQALRKELNAFTSLLEEVKLGEEKEFADFDLVRCFVMPSDDKTISDFIIAVENKDSKMIMYMAGKIKVK